MLLFKPLFILTAGLLLFINTVNANASCPPEAPTLEFARDFIEKNPAKNAGFLWRAEKDGRTSWLYGTIHMMSLDYAKPGMQVMMGMRNADVLAVEIDIYQPQQPISLKNNFSITNTQLERLKAAYAKECLKGDPKDQLLNPLTVSQAHRLNLFWGYGPDARLMQIAKRTNKPIISLESRESQLLALNSKSQIEFDSHFEASLDGFEKGLSLKNIEAQAKAWQSNDLYAAQALEEHMRKISPDFWKNLNDKRNIEMAKKVADLHQSGKRVFVAVGFMHMLGQESIPKLLEADGYKLTFVPLRPL